MGAFTTNTQIWGFRTDDRDCKCDDFCIGRSWYGINLSGCHDQSASYKRSSEEREQRVTVRSRDESLEGEGGKRCKLSRSGKYAECSYLNFFFPKYLPGEDTCCTERIVRPMNHLPPSRLLSAVRTECRKMALHAPAISRLHDVMPSLRGVSIRESPTS